MERAQPGKWVFIALAIQLALVVASIPGHSLHGDEAWLGEQAYFQAKDGYVHSNFFKGFNLQDEQIVVYHRFFISSASFLFNTLGFGLGTMRVIPILCGAILLLLLWVTYRKLLDMSPQLSAMALVVFLMIPQAFYFIKIARPEMMMTLFGFASFALLLYDRKQANWKYILLAGLCAGAAMMTHLNGAIFIGAGVIALLAQRKFLHAAMFCIVAGLVLLPYILDIAANFELFKLQLTNQYVASKTEVSFLSPLINLSREHQRLFRKPEIILPMLVFMISLIVTWRDRRPERMFLRTYCLVLMVLFGMLVEDKTVKYSACLAPFWALVIADAFPAFFARARRWKITAGIAAFGFVAFSLYYQIIDILHKEEYVTLNRTIGSYMPEGSWCVAPLNFMFNEIGRHRIICNELVRLETQNQPTSDNLAAFCDRKGAEYLVFNKYGERIDDMSDLATNRAHVLSLFDVVIENSDFAVFRRKHGMTGAQMH